MEQGAWRQAGRSACLFNRNLRLSIWIYTIPEISFIGKTEEQLTDEDVPYEVGVLITGRLRAGRFAAIRRGVSS